MKIFAFISILLLPVITQAEMPITRGSMLALSCTGCHGTNGKSPGAIPTIAGKSAGSKLEQAKKKNVNVLSEQEALKFLAT